MLTCAPVGIFSHEWGGCDYGEWGELAGHVGQAVVEVAHLRPHGDHHRMNMEVMESDESSSQVRDYHRMNGVVAIMESDASSQVRPVS